MFGVDSVDESGGRTTLGIVLTSPLKCSARSSLVGMLAVVMVTWPCCNPFSRSMSVLCTSMLSFSNLLKVHKLVLAFVSSCLTNEKALGPAVLLGRGA